MRSKEFIQEKSLIYRCISKNTFVNAKLKGDTQAMSIFSTVMLPIIQNDGHN
jgi:hypothetical protein